MLSGASCDDDACPHATHVPKLHRTNFYCRTEFCLEDDETCTPACVEGGYDQDRCCAARAICDSSACTFATHVLKTDVAEWQAGLYCAGAACVEGGVDQHTCCDDRASCISAACTTESHVLKIDTSDLFCVGKACIEGGPDQAICCDDRAACDETACTPATHVLKVDLTGLLCVGATCVEGGVDQAKCCDPRAACDSTACTAATHVLKVDLTSLYCVDTACVEGHVYDQQTCCDLRTPCSSSACTAATHVLKTELNPLLFPGCHTANAGDGNTASCYDKIRWAMNVGIAQSPHWYSSGQDALTGASSWAEIQMYFHWRPTIGFPNGNACHAPCDSSPQCQKVLNS